MTLERDATYWGWLLPDKIVEMTIGKVSHEFCRLLHNNDNGDALDVAGTPPPSLTTGFSSPKSSLPLAMGRLYGKSVTPKH